MAKRNIDLDKTETNSFVKGLNKDSDSSFMQEGMWTHARNVVNNTIEGNLGTLSGEPANYLCTIAGETLPGVRRVIIGTIHLYSDKWIIYTVSYNLLSATPASSEIGLFEEDLCKYRPIVQDPCLKFSELKLIYGAAREQEDCSWAVYWNDGLNPDRYLNIGDPQTWPSKDYIWIGNNTYSNGIDSLQWPGVPWIQDCDDSNSDEPGGCITCVDTTVLDCDKLRLARLMKTPCLHVEAGKTGGTLRNGSYFATIAYSIQGEKVTDWFSGSNVQPIWYEDDFQGALEITVDADEQNFKEFILVVVQTINQGTVAKRIGVYSTNTKSIYLDNIAESLVTVPIEQLPIQTPIYEKSDQIVEVNNYLLRVGPTSKFDFNYQPLANLIRAKWVSVEYPSDYYVKGGYKPSYLRDEVYTFFIRWVYNTGDKSASYHIPGRAAITLPNNFEENQDADGLAQYQPNVLFTDPSEKEKIFEVTNTATITTVSPPEVLEDGGKIIARGNMGYWESTEFYPDDKPEVWNSSSQCWTGVNPPAPGTTSPYDLCGTPIRHHKFPENITQNSDLTNHYAQGGNQIRILGVEFENIICPKDNEGNDIPGIVGYEILRGSREGNKTIIAKGMLNNMRYYNTKGQFSPSSKRKGLYPNYPFNTIQPVGMNNSASGTANDPFITSTDEDGNIVDVNLNDIPKNITTFHSPDTNFRNPYLNPVELKLYGNLRGISSQNFIEPDLHPKHKLLGDLSAFAMVLAGLIEGALSLGGETTYTYPGGSFNREYMWPLGQGTLTPGVPAVDGSYIDEAFFSGEIAVWKNTLWSNPASYFNTGAFIADSTIGNSFLRNRFFDFWNSGNYYTAPNITFKNAKSKIGGYYQTAINFIQYFSQGADLAIRVIYAALPYRQYALQMLAHGFYSTFVKNTPPALEPFFRFRISDSFYLKNNIQEVRPYINSSTGANELYSINNLKRQTTVVLRTKSGPSTNKDTGPYFLNYDNSLVTLGTARGQNLSGSGTVTTDIFEEDKKSSIINAKIGSHYGAIKIRLRNQYGQLDSIKQIPITPCEQKLELSSVEIKKIKQCKQTSCSGKKPIVDIFHKVVTKTPVFFNGDTYINRYTEKNNMFFFYDWLYGQPDGYEYNYALRQMIPFARFAINTEAYELNDFFNPAYLVPGAIATINTSYLNGYKPSSKYILDSNGYDYITNDPEGTLLNIGIKERYFYLAASSIRDFFVESEVLVDFREAGDTVYEKFYNPYSFTDLPTMFTMNPDVITRGNYYAYDYSLSIGKLYTQYFSQGNLQSRYYDPNVASLCYTYRPDRIIYSLPQSFESAKDSWFIYLANNYKEFKDQISGVKNFARTGIFITFKNSSPQLFQGVDQLQTEAGVKVTLGDGGLFTQTPQSVSVADPQYEYGSCQNRNSVIATPVGMFYISQNQGKIFRYGQGLEEISQLGLKWWFVLYLPYKLTEDFPEYPYQDNPVAGIGCQSIYSNRDGILYFSKKDYKLKEQYVGRTIYDPCTNFFIVDGIAKYKLGNPLIFHDASWTVSFDPKSNFFISFHDWHPDLMLPSKITFMTTQGAGIWVHNNTCTQFCNYYGKPEVMEIELPITTGQTVTTLRSVEYILEAYKRYDCVDQFHILDQNFDHAFIYNSEQVSGHMHLNLFPKNNITLAEQYPIVNPNSISILYSKEENKYRFNQFWDITKDRGEFPIGSNYPPTGPVIPGTTILQGPKADERIWITEPNGYIRDLNPANLDYNKPTLQRKKFRHYLNYLVLRKDVVGDVDMILKLTNAKQVYSPR